MIESSFNDLSMIEKLKESVDSGGAFDALMTDLSKAFDCLRHELLIPKLGTYGFDIKPVKLIQQYLSNRKQRVNVGNAYSSWKEIHRDQSLAHLFSKSFCVTYLLLQRSRSSQLR